MEHTLFFVLGITLVVAALAVSFVGLRWERFPGSGAALAGVLALFAGLIVATAAFAWMNAEEEQDEKAPELAEERAAAAEEAIAEESATVDTAEGDTDAAAQETASAEGEQLFNSEGCSGCHTLSASGASATTGPNLDDALAEQPPSFIEESIVDPNAEIAEGYPPDLMPQNFSDTMSPDQIKALVKYLAASTSSTAG
jgi:mono/diheme cytochrome c family protein